MKTAPEKSPGPFRLVAGTVSGSRTYDHDGPKALGPPHGVVVAGLARREFSVCQGFTGIRDDSEMVAVQMGVGADDDTRRCCHDGGVPSRWLIASGWVTPGGARRQHIDEELPGS